LSFITDSSAVTIAVDPFISGNDRSPVTIAVVTVISIILVIIVAVALIFIKKKRSRKNADNLQELGLVEAEKLLVDKTMAITPSQCIRLLTTVKSKQKLDLYGKEILRVLKEVGESILENEKFMLNMLIAKASELIDSEYYEDIIKVVPYGGVDSPLKYLNQLTDDEESFKKLFKDQKKLMSVIQVN